MYRKFNVEERTIGDSIAFVIRSKNVAPKRRCLFLHGGGGMMRATPFHYMFITRLILQTHAEVWMPFYPLAPDYVFYDSLAACFATYRTMLSHEQTLPIYFAGDSAGANLELAVCRSALDSGLDIPSTIVCISPATGFEDPNYRANFFAQTQRTKDPLLCVEMVDAIRNNWYKGVPLDDPLGNPAAMDYAGFPPTLIYLGTAEIFYPYTEGIVRRMEASGLDLSCVRGHELMHDWALLNYFPEGAAAQGLIKRFVLEHC